MTISELSTGKELCKDLQAPDTCTIGNVVLTVNKVYISGPDKWVTITANTGSTFDSIKIVPENKQTITFNPTVGHKSFVVSWSLPTTNITESYTLSARISTDNEINRVTINELSTGKELCEDLQASDTCTIGNVILTVNKVYYVPAGDRRVTLTTNTGSTFDLISFVPSNRQTITFDITAGHKSFAVSRG